MARMDAVETPRDLPTSVSLEDLRSKITNLVEQFRLEFAA
jgi:hypothetical protein